MGKCKGKRQVTLDRPATYEIRVPGRLDERWTEWDGRMTVTVEEQDAGPPITVLTGTLDQAALQGILRRLYALGLPLISVTCVDTGEEYAPEVDLQVDAGSDEQRGGER